MARIKIEPPTRVIYSTNLQVRVTDLNYGNHLGNDALLGLLHEARLGLYSSLGFPDERNIFGAGVIMADVAVQYINEAFLHDNLTIRIGIADVGRMNYDLIYELENQNEKIVARAKTGLVCFDYESRKPTAVPQAFLEAIALK